MDDISVILAAALGVAGTVGGVIAGASLTRRHRATDELSVALVGFLAELDAVAVTTRRALVLPRWIDATNAWLARRVPLVDYFAEEFMRATIGRRLVEQEHRFRLAANRVLLIAPPDLTRTVLEALRLVQSADRRDEHWLTRWLTTRDQLQAQAREAVGSKRLDISG